MEAEGREWMRMECSEVGGRLDQRWLALRFFLMVKTFSLGAWEIAQSLKFSLYKHEILNFNLVLNLLFFKSRCGDMHL